LLQPYECNLMYHYKAQKKSTLFFTILALRRNHKINENDLCDLLTTKNIQLLK